MDNFGQVGTKLINCTFAQNYAYFDGGAVSNDSGESGVDPNLVTQYINSIFWGNTSQFDITDQVYNFEIIPEYINCIVQYSGGSTNWEDTVDDGYGIGSDGGNNLDISPDFTDSVGCDFTLQMSSPAINAGIDSVNNTPIDLNGNLRIIGLAIDLGAFEFGRYTYIPDDAFKSALISQGIDSDGILNDSVLTADISSLLGIALPGEGILDMTRYSRLCCIGIFECR